MKKVIVSLAFCTCCIFSYAQDTMSKKMENKTDKMNRKMENKGDKMNKKMGNTTDSMKMDTRKHSDTAAARVRRTTRPSK